MKIRARLYLSSTITTCLVVILVWVMFLGINKIDEKSREYKLAHDVQLAISQLNIIVSEYLEYHEKRMEQQWHLKYDSTLSMLVEEVKSKLSESIWLDYIAIGGLFSQISADQGEMQKLIEEGAAQKKIDAVDRLEERLVAQLLIRSQSIMNDADRFSRNSMVELAKTQEAVRNSTLLVVVVLVVLIIITTLVISRTISKSLTELTKGTKIIGKGNLEYRIDIRSKDEMAELGAFFNEMVKDLKDTQEELLRSERLSTLGQLSGSISHELRNPLGVIDSSAYYLKQRLKDVDEKVQTHLGRIRSGVERATGIIESLLSLTRMKAPRLERLDLIALTAKAIRTAKVPVTINVTENFPEQDILIDADREQLRMAFQNIIDNAVQAMDSKGTLTVTVSEITGGRAEVSFADTGSGVTPENLDKVFRPLFSTRARGIGLGLSIAKMIIDKHNGTIEAKSDLGKGTIFIIRLPLSVDKRKQGQKNAWKVENTGY